jgi:anaerobic ribonucleoside-triphosphate reductase
MIMSCVTSSEIVSRQYRGLPDSANVGKNIHFVRVRRITGYLVGGGVARFNDGKKAELRDRVKHDRV